MNEQFSNWFAAENNRVLEANHNKEMLYLFDVTLFDICNHYDMAVSNFFSTSKIYSDYENRCSETTKIQLASQELCQTALKDKQENFLDFKPQRRYENLLLTHFLRTFSFPVSKGIEN